jgi:hypothetical protein
MLSFGTSELAPNIPLLRFCLLFYSINLLLCQFQSAMPYCRVLYIFLLQNRLILLLVQPFRHLLQFAWHLYYQAIFRICQCSAQRIICSRFIKFLKLVLEKLSEFGALTMSTKVYLKKLKKVETWFNSFRFFFLQYFLNYISTSFFE